MKNLTLFLALAALVQSASAVAVSINKTYVVEPSGTVPFIIWVGAIVVGIILVLISFLHFSDGEEGLVSIVSWFPIGFAFLTAFAVDRITSTGYSVAADGTPILIEMHTVSSYWYVAIPLLVFLIFAIGNTIRIYSNQAGRKQIADEPPHRFADLE